MKDITTQWTKNEFKAYLLLFGAYVDMVEHKKERNMIKEKVGKSTYKKVHEEFDEDNDYVRIQKMKNTASRLEYTQEQIDSLIQETVELFKCDGEYLQIEQNMHRQLKRLLKQ